MLSRQKEERIYRRIALSAGVVGIGLIVLGGVRNSVAVLSIGVLVFFVGIFGPRMKGRFELAFHGLKLTGELTVEPDGDDDEEPPQLPPGSPPRQLPPGGSG